MCFIDGVRGIIVYPKAKVAVITPHCVWECVININGPSCTWIHCKSMDFTCPVRVRKVNEGQTEIYFLLVKICDSFIKIIEIVKLLVDRYGDGANVIYLQVQM